MDLAYKPRKQIKIDGQLYDLNLAYDNVLRLFDLLEDEIMPEEIVVITALELLVSYGFEEYTAAERKELLLKLFFDTIGEPEEPAEQSVDIAGNPMPENEDEEVKQNFSIKQDGAFIFASFMSDYGIDLIEEQGKMSWQKFNALLSGLSPESKFMRVIDIRTRKLPTGKGTAEERKQLKKLKEQFKLKEG